MAVWGCWMGRFAALALVALVGLAAGLSPAGAEYESEVEATSIQEPPLDLATRIRSASASGDLTVDLSVLEFIALQRLAQEERQRLLGLAPGCQSRMTAVSTASAPSARLHVSIACSR